MMTTYAVETDTNAVLCSRERVELDPRVARSTQSNTEVIGEY